MVKVGILGGGQLGRMLLQQAANYPVETFVLENDEQCPAAHLCHHFVLGNITQYDDVLAFGKKVEVLTIEIENVNIEALETLETLGKTVIPSAAVLRLIKNKITQKQFYEAHQIPSAPFVVTHTLLELDRHISFLPAVHKIAEGGYDGRGVQMLHTPSDFEKGFDAPAILEKKVTLTKEIALLLAINTVGEIAIYPPVEMLADAQLNQLDYLISPAQLPENLLWKIEAIGIKLVKALKSPGFFVIELMIDSNKEVWVNETAPRVHNSGHHTIEANFCSQYDMVWRLLLGYPLGNTDSIKPAATINLTGAPGQHGPVAYLGLQEALKMEQTYLHIYGKKETKPGRKMGHLTLLGENRIDLIHKINSIKPKIKVEAKNTQP